MGLSEGGLVGYGNGFLPLLEDVVGGVLVGGVGGDTFEQISGLFAQTNGLFTVGIPDNPVMVNVGNCCPFGFPSAPPGSDGIAT